MACFTIEYCKKNTWLNENTASIKHCNFCKGIDKVTFNYYISIT